MLTVDFEYFDLQPGHVCVDLGCGEGRHSLTAYLQEAYGDWPRLIASGLKDSAVTHC